MAQEQFLEETVLDPSARELSSTALEVRLPLTEVGVHSFIYSCAETGSDLLHNCTEVCVHSHFIGCPVFVVVLAC